MICCGVGRSMPLPANRAFPDSPHFPPEDALMLRYAVLLAALLMFAVGPGAIAADATDLPLVFEDDFEKGADRWQPTDAEAWKVVATDRGKVYNQFKLSDYKPPHRSPHNISLAKGVSVGDFVLTVEVQSTNSKAGAHRDMCLFFNYVDRSHFYYVHLGKKPDPHSSQIMIVNDAPRKMITTNKSPGIPWDDGWHQIKLVRRVKAGTIELYFDDMREPAKTAVDKDFAWGRIGLGSFGDTDQWDDVKLYGEKVEPPAE